MNGGSAFVLDAPFTVTGKREETYDRRCQDTHYRVQRIAVNTFRY